MRFRKATRVDTKLEPVLSRMPKEELIRRIISMDNLLGKMVKNCADDARHATRCKRKAREKEYSRRDVYLAMVRARAYRLPRVLLREK